ncbi:DUF2635 domain-containing protein [Salmonella enterica subsp. diarizonae]|nr:DUF2635 domain-containing protein [Salmonella enterica subsp. diarizonae]EHN1695350.1 DUF2635 domain-containing protein [Salmonella enterica subsp. enterica serovar Newport]
MFVKPVAGRSVRCPVRGTFLPESGGNVPDDIFWRRRLQDGDVILSKPEKAASASQPAQVAEKREGDA